MWFCEYFYRTEISIHELPPETKEPKGVRSTWSCSAFWRGVHDVKLGLTELNLRLFLQSVYMAKALWCCCRVRVSESMASNLLPRFRSTSKSSYCSCASSSQFSVGQSFRTDRHRNRETHRSYVELLCFGGTYARTISATNPPDTWIHSKKSRITGKILRLQRRIIIEVVSKHCIELAAPECSVLNHWRWEKMQMKGIHDKNRGTIRLFAFSLLVKTYNEQKH